MTLALLLPACGGGSTTTVFADANVLFPPHFLVSNTTADRIHVRGRATATQALTGVRVNGVPATTTNGWQTWTADIPLSMGINTITVDVAVSVGAIPGVDTVRVQRVASPAAMAVGNGPLFDGDLRNPIWYADGYYAYVLVENRGGFTDDVLMLVTLASGDRELFYDPEAFPPWGYGPNLMTARSLAWAGPENCLVADQGWDAVIRLEPLSGKGEDVTTLAVGAAIDVPSGAAALGSPDVFLVANEGSHELVRVNVLAGTRTLVSGGATGSGPAFEPLTAVVAASGNTMAYVADLNVTGRILSVDLGTGNRSVLSGGGAGSGPDLGRVYDLVRDDARNRLLLTDSSSRVFAVDLGTGNRTVLTGPTFRGPPADVRGGTLIDATGQLMLLASREDMQVADLVTGDRVVVSR